MNKSKRGQSTAAGVGVILVVLLAVLVGTILFRASAQNVGDMVNTITVANQSLDIGVNNTAIYITGYRAVASPVVYNITADAVMGATNYTITNNVVYNGALAIKFVPHVAAAAYLYDWNISGVFQPTTYSDNAGARSMAGLVIVFFALAVAVIALWPVFQSKIIN